MYGCLEIVRGKGIGHFGLHILVAGEAILALKLQHVAAEFQSGIHCEPFVSLAFRGFWAMCKPAVEGVICASDVLGIVARVDIIEANLLQIRNGLCKIAFSQVGFTDVAVEVVGIFGCLFECETLQRVGRRRV